MIAAKSMVGSEMYTVRETAFYSRVPAQMVSRWIFGSEKGRSVIEPQIANQERMVSFVDFVQTVAIRELRFQKEVPLPRFREAIRNAKKLFGIDYPFARRHCTFFDGVDIIIKKADEFYEVTGKHVGQKLFRFVEEYLAKLEFDANGLADSYRIFEAKDVPILMRPKYRFGEPTLPSGYTAMTIWNAIKAEGGIKEAAKAYGIPKEEVEAAYAFFVDFLGKATA
ncbi:MAG: hypothetical protein K2X38_10905 [Gemmataceae bacterium]|nr:hypothetical protein [Gemmataceae bacterium]